MKKNKLTAVIPVRKGSQRVKNKNLKPFAGSTLLDIKIETLKKVIGLDEIVVSSDSDEMLDIARKHNVTAHKREDYYASSEVNNSDLHKHKLYQTLCLQTLKELHLCIF